MKNRVKFESDRMALKLNGKDDHLRRADFRMLATTAGLRSLDAEPDYRWHDRTLEKRH
jgi:hypothetical protein